MAGSKVSAGKWFLIASVAVWFAAQGPALPAQQQGAKPSINDTWKNSNIGPLVDILEAESREIYHERAGLADLVGLHLGSSIADVGAGSGFMVEEFARRVGAQGKVYAVDINPKLLEHIADRAREADLANVETVLTPEDGVNLPPSSVDFVFVCDTYHHFEYPQKSLAGIHQALRPGGELILVEFRRVEGESPEWMMNHVRAGREVFTREIEQAGFRLIQEEQADFLRENYVLRFRKREN